MDISILLTLIGSICGGLAIWDAISRPRTKPEPLPQHRPKTRFKNFREYARFALQEEFGAARGYRPRRTRGRGRMTRGYRLFLENEGSRKDFERLRTGREENELISEAPPYLVSLLSRLPDELAEYQDEICDFVVDGIRDRRRHGRSSRPFVMSQALQIGVTILRSKIKISVTRRWTLK